MLDDLGSLLNLVVSKGSPMEGSASDVVNSMDVSASGVNQPLDHISMASNEGVLVRSVSDLTGNSLQRYSLTEPPPLGL